MTRKKVLFLLFMLTVINFVLLQKGGKKDKASGPETADGAALQKATLAETQIQQQEEAAELNFVTVERSIEVS